MAKNLSRSEKYKNIVLDYNFPHPGHMEADLPVSSLEDTRDSRKKDIFSVDEEDAR